MKLQRLLSAGIISVLLPPLAGISAFGDEPRKPWLADGSKMAIESPVKRLISVTSANPAMADRRLSTNDTAVVSPKVLPGKVAWHPDFNSACAAARRSGRPVLLFHMMGKLDDRFC